MRRLTDEATPLLPGQATDANVQERQLTRPGVLNPLYLIFPALSCIGRFLPMETLLSFRLANRQLNDASEKAFLYWVTLMILRNLKKIPDQENILNVIMPHYLRCYQLKTIQLRPEFKNFISGEADMNEFAGKLYLSQRSELTIELAEKQKYFIQLCRDIGSAPEGEIKCNSEYLNRMMCAGFLLIFTLAPACSLLTFAVSIYKDKNRSESDRIIPVTAMSVFSFILFAFSAYIIKTGMSILNRIPTIPADIGGAQLVLSTCSARLFQSIADTAQTVSVPVNWTERLSEQVETVVRN